MSNVKFQSREVEENEATSAYAITYFGSKAEMDALAATYTIGASGGSSYGNARLISKKVRQQSPNIWECELRYQGGSATHVEIPERGYGVKLTTLHGAMLSRPLESHPDYLTQWNHYLFAAPGESTTVPQWATAATDAIITGDNAQKYAWGKSLSEAPVTAAGRWQTLAKPLKPGYDSYDVATYTITETVRCASRNSAGSQVAGVLNKIGSPGTTLGITGGNWKCDDAEVSWNGRYWVARLTWTRSGDNSGWDEDLYESVNHS